MKEIKNKVITISGEPVSGKSTVVKMLKEKYEQKGYTVHVISTGDIFREVIKREYLKMYPDRPNANLADIQADEQFISKRNEIDQIIDGEMAKKGIEINSKARPNEVFIIDSRLAWHNIPISYAVRLTVDDKIAGKRALADKTRGVEDQYVTEEDAIEKTRKRKLGEIERYKARYGVDLSNPENYDLIVDTSYSNTEELADIIIKGEETYRQGGYYPKTWASPVHFLTTQTGRETAFGSVSGNTIDSLIKVIKEKGYDPVDGILELVEHNGIKFLIEGNHRVMAGLSCGKSLFPYEISNKDNAFSAGMANIVYKDTTLERMYDWIEGIAYYGGRVGQIEQLRGLGIRDLLSVAEIPIAREMLKLDAQGKDER